ncbi:Uncharacterised protein [uncultured archaeon]|nr:Uncharacterised protein [uncultured archaeon]
MAMARLKSNTRRPSPAARKSASPAFKKPAPRPGHPAGSAPSSGRFSGASASRSFRKPSSGPGLVYPASTPGFLSLSTPARVAPPPAPALPSMPVSLGPLTDAQTLEMLELGQHCYSLFGQTRLFWSRLKLPYSQQPWLRFHFLQASMLFWAFAAVYAVSLVAIALREFTGVAVLPPLWAEGLLVLALLSHVILFSRLGHAAGNGRVPVVPLFGDRAMRMATSQTSLFMWKI